MIKEDIKSADPQTSGGSKGGANRAKVRPRGGQNVICPPPLSKTRFVPIKLATASEKRYRIQNRKQSFAINVFFRYTEDSKNTGRVTIFVTIFIVLYPFFHIFF